MSQSPFPTELWLIAAKHLANAFGATKRWLDAYQPPQEAETGELRMEMTADGPLADGEPQPRRVAVVQAFVGQTGRAVVKMADAAGRTTDNYDTMTGIMYETDDEEVVTIVDDDALPKDARLEAVGVGVARVRCTFDGDPGDGIREIALQSEEIEVLEPPPGEAVTGEFTVTFEPVA